MTRPRVIWTGLALVLSIAALTTLLLHRHRAPPANLWLSHAAHRSQEARLSYTGADVYRPYDSVRAGAPVSPAPLPLRELAVLEEARDFHGLADAYLLRGNTAQAAAFLESAGHSPDLDSDRAVLALSRGDFEAALAQLEGPLSAVPQHPQALWNRGLALRNLGLPLLAAESFERVAALGEPGWSTEARQRAEALRRQVSEYREAHAAAKQAGEALCNGGPVPLEAARAFPGVLRLYFYDALRAAPTRERALELLPLAAELDAHEGKDTLRTLVQRVADRDFSIRGPLAREYGRLRRESRPPPEWQPLIDGALRAHEDDLFLGALLFAQAVPSHLDAYEATAARTGDTWFSVLAARQRALVEKDRGEPRKAEQTLQGALRLCADSRLDFRCSEIEQDLALLYVALHRPADAHQHAWAGLQRARRGPDWDQEQRLLQVLGLGARMSRAFPLAEAWYGEVLAREKDPCRLGRLVHQQLAVMYQLELRPDAAREHLQRALSCGPLDNITGVAVLAELARSSRTLEEDAKHLRAALELLRPRLGPGERALLAHYEGRFELERDRQRGLALLRRNLEDTAALALQDVDARKARTASYTALLMDAGRTGDFAAALSLFAEEQGLPVPERCSLAATVDDERTLLVARGQDGQVRGHYDTGRTMPFRDVDGLVPEALLAALRPCEHVLVLARPPVHGHSGLLPPELAWSYHVGHRAHAPSAPAAPRHLVVADVEPPPGLGLPRLNAWTPGDTDARRVVLAGASATPGRVLAEMADATEIELHTHGLIDPDVSDASLVVLSPEADGRYALTAREVRGQVLRGAPVVILGACRAAHTAPFLHEPFSLPVAFVEAGARAVFAATVDLPDAQAGPFFDAVRARIRAGAAPSVALRDERLQWLQRPGAEWVRQVLLFE